MLPGGQSTSIHVKGLTCFVAKHGQNKERHRPTPALTVHAERDPQGSLDLVSTGRQVLGEMSWSFGQASPQGRLFVMDGQQLLVPYSEAQQAVALMLSRGSDLVVMCRR
jgi:hypothetical protein